MPDRDPVRLWQKTETFLLRLTASQTLNLYNLGRGLLVDYTLKYEGADQVNVNGFPLTEAKGAITFGGYAWAFKQGNVKLQFTGGGTLYFWYTVHQGFYDNESFEVGNEISDL